jgi:hypothetical protein
MTTQFEYKGHKVEEGEFLLVVPSIGLIELYRRFRYAVEEALSFKSVDPMVHIWNHQGRLVFGNLIDPEDAVP